MEPQQKYDFVIIGGGVYGLSIAYHLSKSQKSVALFERFTIGHSNGSSHGPQRITRSVYEHQFYRDMNTLALKEYWPEMEQVLNSKFIYPNQFIFMDERKDEYDRAYKVAKGAKTKISFMSSEDICKKFPSMPYIKCSNTPIVDFEAAMIASDDYISRLTEYLKTLPNLAIFENTLITQITKNTNHVRIATESEIIHAQKIVVAAGRWVLDLFPELNDILHVSKQYLAYVKLENPQMYQFGRIPSFVYVTQDTDYYTTPDRKGLGFKIGSHSMRKQTRDEATAMKQVRENHVKVVQELFKQKYKGISKYDECYYTVNKAQNFLIDWIDPDTEQILICSCCSGHGFKFSPLIGKVISDILLTNKSIQVFERNRHICMIPFHRGMDLN